MSMIETSTHNTDANPQQQNTPINSTPGPEDVGNLETPTTVRKRTRATAEQLSVLEDTFAANVSPNSKLRKELSERLQMSERSIQIWFQNRRAKVKHMQKRAQMQMQQASIRAQLYHYHHHQQQQQYGTQSYGGTHIMPLPEQQQQQQHQQHQHQQVYYPHVPRSSSVDSASLHSSLSPSSPNSLIPSTHPLSYPDTMDLPDYFQGGGLLSPSPSPHHDYTSAGLSSSMPLLVAVPDAGPTAMLATTTPSLSSSSSSISSSSSTSSMTPGHLSVTSPLNVLDQVTVRPQDIWPSHHDPQHAMRSQSVAVAGSLQCSEISTIHPLERSLSNPPMTTIDPSSLMMNTSPKTSSPLGQQQQQQQIPDFLPPSPSDLYLNCTTLTIGTWHRLKLRASDLLCVFKNNRFEWHIEDAGCHFKMEIPLTSVANIDFIQDNNILADVHFDISESPLFYMETTSHSGTSWVQCSDFTEGKQASRFFRHSLKGVSQQMKQDLMMLMDQCPETRRWIRFVEQPQQISYPPSSDPAFDYSYIPPTSYWSSMYPIGAPNYLV